MDIFIGMIVGFVIASAAWLLGFVHGKSDGLLCAVESEGTVYLTLDLDDTPENLARKKTVTFNVVSNIGEKAA